MKNIFKFGLFSIIVISFNAQSAIKELTLISLNSGEILTPSEHVNYVAKNALHLFDGRIIGSSEIENVEVMHANGSSEIVDKGLFKIIKVNAAKISIGGDNSGGG